MNVKRITFFALALLLVLPLSLAFGQDTVTIRLWTGSSSPAENEALEAQIALFEEANPTIDVEVLISPDYNQTLTQGFAANDYAEVFAVGQFDFPNWRAEGRLAPADGAIVEQDDIYPGLLNAFTYEGEVYCPPKDFSTLALYYNRDHFDAAGLEYPTAEWTWDDLYAAAEALTNDEHVGMSVAPDHNRWLAFFYANGARLMDEEGSLTFNSAEAAASLDYYASFVLNGVGNTPSNLDSGWNGEAFGRGLASMTVEGNWGIGFLEEQYPDLNWGVAELPTAPSGEKGTLTFTVCWGVAASTEDGGPNQFIDESWALVNFLTGPGEGGAQFVATAGFGVMPARASAGDLWLETRGEEFAPFVIGAEYAWAPVFPVGFADFTDTVVNGMNAVLSGDQSAQELLDEAQAVGEEIMAEME